MLNEVAVVSPDDAWAVGRKYVPVGSDWETQTYALHWDGSAWSVVPTPSPSPYPGGGWADLQTVHAVTSDDVWAAGGQRIQAPDGFVGTHLMVQHWDGSQWSLVDAPITVGGSGNFVDDIEVVAEDDVWFVGDWLEFPPQNAAEKRALAMHWNGSSLVVHDTPFFDNNSIGGHGLTAISAVSSDDIWAVGGGHDGDYVSFSYIVHWDGQHWEHVPGPTAGWFHRLYDVQAVASDEVYAVGDYQDDSGYHGMLLRWDGSSWTRLPDPPAGGASIEVLGPAQVYVAGAGVALWDGATWTVVATFPTLTAPSIWSLETDGPCSLWGSGAAWEAPDLVALTVRLEAGDGGTVYCDETQDPDNAADIAISTNDSGSPSILVTLSQAPSGQFTYLLVGDGTGAISNPPGSEGTLCIAGGTCLGRYDKDVQQVSAGGSASTDIRSPLSSPCNGAVDIVPGATWNFQYWHRQPMGQPSSFSAAISVTFQ